MAVAGPLIDILGQRTDDLRFTGTDKPTLRIFLAHAQRLWSLARNITTSTATLTMTPRRVWFDYSEIAADVVRVREILHNNIALRPSSISLLGQLNRHWFREVAGRPTQFTNVGRDALIIHPGVDYDETLTVTYEPSTGELPHDNSTLTVAELWHNGMLEMTEALVYLRTRDLARAERAIKVLEDELLR